MEQQNNDIESRWQLLTEHEKILIRPARYLGPIENDTKERYIIHKGEMQFTEVTYNPALLKMFDEIVSNSVDASTREDLKHLNKIDVTVSELTGTITIDDNGGIPVQIHKDHDMYLPELIFGHLHSGENFGDDDSTATGQNGEGAGLVNIFSTMFRVVTCDGTNSFSKTWSNNMQESTKEKIKPSTSKATSITFCPDYKRLGCSLGKDDNLKLLKQRTIEIAACNPHLEISFNGEKIKLSSFKDFIKLHQDDFIYIENDDWKVGLAPSDSGTMEQISFINSTNTYIGGTHISYIADQMIDDIRKYVSKKFKYDVKPAEIKNHFRLFICATIVNPRYNSQTKEDLVTLSKNYKTSIKLTDAFIKKVINSPVLSRLVEMLEAKRIAADKRESTKQARENKRKKVSGHLPANSNDIEQRILHITEGLSAISNLINVRDPEIHGGYPLKGKFLNTRELSDAKLLEKTPKGEFKNKEVAELMSVIGLEPDGVLNLNYGKIAIMADADYDGYCIVGQLLNFFSRWPDLFNQGRVLILVTPIVIAKKDKQIERFFDYNEFKAFNSDGYSVEYLKGLGSLDESEYDRAVNNPKYLTVSNDVDWSKTLDLVFNQGKNESGCNFADMRKEWLLNDPNGE